MTKEEAIRILDLETRASALAEIGYYGGFHGMEALLKAVDDACRIAVDALRERGEVEKNDLLTLEELEKIKTCDLVAELSKREGVEAHTAEPYKDMTVSVNGPAVVLVVTD